jgi:hypothetical protein
MIIHGRDVKFRRTVLGNCEIAEICPDKDINRFTELISGDYATAQTAAAVFIAALSKGYEMAQRFEDPSYVMHPCTQEEAMLLDSDEFNALFSEALDAFKADGKTTVEAEAPKRSKKSGAAESA